MQEEGGWVFDHLFEQQARLRPDALALIACEQTITYRQLNRAANRIARSLIAAGVSPETLVGLFQERSPALIAALLGIWKAGGAYLPCEPQHPHERLRYVLEESQVRLILTSAHLRPRLPEGARAIVLEPEGLFEGSDADDENPAVSRDPHDLAYVLFTSGSTGRPKGVCIEHRGLNNLLQEQRRIFQLRPCDRVLQLSSISFDASVFEIGLAFSAGATLCLASPSGLTTGLTLFQLLQRLRISCVTIVPSLLQLLAPGRLPELRTIISAGEACGAELVDRWAMDGRRFFNAYGPTETTIWATIARCQPGGGKPAIGQPLRNTHARVLDERLRPVPPGSAGELCLGGVHLARGYLRAPELTRERFVPDPLAAPGANARLYRTGDLARVRPDGQLECLGRCDRQIKLRGYRIEPSEIEEALRQHPAVRQALVLAWSETGARQVLIAYLVLAPGQEAPAEQLKAFLSLRLPAYMLPAHYLRLAAMPLSSSGKIDAAALPRPSIDRAEPEGPTATELERRVARMFAAALGVEGVPWDSRFFDDLGGDSLAAVDLMTRIETELSLSLPLRTLFEHDTVRRLSAAIRTGGQAPEPVDWERELQLEPELVRAVAAQATGPRILLTGATGFVGAFLLQELLARTDARVVCLTRAQSDQKAWERLQAALSAFGLWDQIDAGRVEAIPGEISQPDLALDPARYESLASSIDAVYHCAAWVNFVYPYKRLKSVNVDGTKNLIRFASQGRRKQMHHISSLAVYGSVGYFGKKHIAEEELEHIDSLYMGYAESKAVSERLVGAAGDQGLPVKIYRLDDVIGHSKSGLSNTDDFICRYLKGSIQLGLYPDLDIRINAVPVDVVARVICHLSLAPGPARCFNIFNPHSVSHHQLFDQFRKRGYRLRQVPYRPWRGALLRSLQRDRHNALAALVSLFTDTFSPERLTIPEMYQEARRPVFSDRNTTAALAGSGIRIPPLDAALFDRYQRYFIASGFLPEPAAHPRPANSRSPRSPPLPRLPG